MHYPNVKAYARTPASKNSISKVRRRPSPYGADCLTRARRRRPNSSPAASEVAAPKPYVRSRSEVPTLGPRSAAPVRISPSTGPAQGAQTKPVATPSSIEEPAVAPLAIMRCPAQRESLDPIDTTGIVMRAARVGMSIVSPNSVISARAAILP